MEYLSYYGLDEDLFNKGVSSEVCYESKDYKNVISRLNYLKEIKGIGLFTGAPGLGKTYTLRCFIDSLNKDLYKIIYILPTNLSRFEFLGNIAKQLNIDVGRCYKDELYQNIQNEIKRLVNNQRMNVIIIIDDAQSLNPKILGNLKILFDFQIDSKDYTTIVLCGQDELKLELSKITYQALQQRIVVNYRYDGLTREEVNDYVKTRLNLANQKSEVFTQTAINALYNVSKGNIRRLNSLITNCLIIGCQNNKTEIDEEIVMLAKQEIDFMD